MAVWENAIITNKGLALLAKLASGNTLSLTSAVAGAGTVDPTMLKYQTTVADEKQELAFAMQSYPEEGKCAVPVKLTNAGVNTAYAVKQIGIMAFDPDDGDVLFMIAQETSGEGTDIPTEDDMPGFSAEWTFYLQYGQADGVEVAVDPSNTVTPAEVQRLIEEHDAGKNPHAEVLASKQDLTDHINSKGNVHGLTPADLGLGNVNNTTDNQKYVAYAREAGEASKTKYAVIIRFNGGRTENTDMWTFDGSTSRSINITPQKIGAAEAEHTHDDRYYTQTAVDFKFDKVDLELAAHSHTAAQVGALPASGGKVTGPLTLGGILVLTEDVHYGATLPAAGTKGRIFLKKVSS